MKIRTILAIALLGAVSTASAYEMTLTPGHMATEMLKVKGVTDSRLVLKGTADITDLWQLRELPVSYTTVDLGGLTVEAYPGEWQGKTGWEAGEIPANLISGTRVTLLTLPANVSRLDEHALAFTLLKEVTLPATVKAVGDYAFAGSRELTKVIVKGEPAYGKGVFRDCEALSELISAKPLVDVSEGMFKGCKALMHMPEGVKSIGADGFRESGIVSLDLSGITVVGSHAFADCKDLVEVTLGDNAIAFGDGVFNGDEGLVDLPEWKHSIPDLMATGTSVAMTAAINAPEVGEAAFAGNGNISVLNFGSAVANIKAHAFRHVKRLKSVNALDLRDKIPAVDATSFSGMENEEGRYPVKLTVDENAVESWKAHPVWGLFDIRSESTNVALTPGDDSGISVRRNGATVYISSVEELKGAQVYGMNGICYFDGGAGLTHLEVEVPAGEIVAVRVATATGSKAVKLK